MTVGRIAAYIIISAGCVSASGAQPVDSLRVDSLSEVTVTAVGPVRTISREAGGRAVLSRKGLRDVTSFMGSGDAIGVLRTMPEVATGSELQATLHVKGSPNGSSSYYADGMRIVNPLHLLGFYSAFNPDFYEMYDFRTGYIPATSQTTAGAIFEAGGEGRVVDSPKVSASIGLIESHFAAGTPLVAERMSLTVGGRMAYPSVVFPGMLSAGSSRLAYGFWDANVSLTSCIGGKDILSVTAFADRDNMDVSNHRQGMKEGYFRWSNIAAGAAWLREAQELRVYWTQYRNALFISQAGRELDLPSGLDQVTAVYSRTFGYGWQIEGDANWRRTSGQRNRSLPVRNGVAAREAFEWSAGAAWSHGFGAGFSLDAGLRVSVYHTSGYSHVAPQPRILVKQMLGRTRYVALSYQRQVRFDRLIETSPGGMPSDFWTSASGGLPPEDVHAVEASAGGDLPWGAGTFLVGIYAKRSLHAVDYAGSVMDMLSPSYDATGDIVEGKGWSRGLSVSLLRQFGRLRGRVGYNLGRTTLHCERFGKVSYPASYDRTHDLNASLVWEPWPWLLVSGTYVYATGLPYTQARYGYMIGENLICEYYPHNSSRLPDYNRLDLSVSWQHTGSRGLSHRVTLSLYNALCSRNVLFRYQDYSQSEGVASKSSVMDMVIPSVTYSISFE